MFAIKKVFAQCKTLKYNKISINYIFMFATNIAITANIQLIKVLFSYIIIL